MDLLLELRLDIYELVLPKHEVLSFGNMAAYSHPPMTSPAITNHLGKHLPLTQVSRQVRDETTPILYGKNKFEVILRSDKVFEVPKQSNRNGRNAKNNAKWLASHYVDYSLTYGDRHAAAWARVARPEAIAHTRYMGVMVEKADHVFQWRHMRQLSLSPSSLSLERTGLFSARKWHMHAIELKCPGRITWQWEVDCRPTPIVVSEKSLQRKAPTPFEPMVHPEQCTRCRMMIEDWRTDGKKEGGMSREHFLALVWYGGHTSPLQ